MAAYMCSLLLFWATVMIADNFFSILVRLSLEWSRLLHRDEENQDYVL